MEVVYQEKEPQKPISPKQEDQSGTDETFKSPD